MTVAPEISTSFAIAGWDFDLDEVTRAVGLDPTRTWRQKKPELVGRKEIPNRSWEVGLYRRPLYSVNDAVAEVLQIVWPARARIVQNVSEHKLESSLVVNVTITDGRPLYELAPATMAQLAQLDAEFLLDIFDYSD